MSGCAGEKKPILDQIKGGGNSRKLNSWPPGSAFKGCWDWFLVWMKGWNGGGVFIQARAQRSDMTSRQSSKSSINICINTCWFINIPTLSFQSLFDPLYREQYNSILFPIYGKIYGFSYMKISSESSESYWSQEFWSKALRFTSVRTCNVLKPSDIHIALHEGRLWSEHRKNSFTSDCIKWLYVLKRSLVSHRLIHIRPVIPLSIRANKLSKLLQTTFPGPPFLFGSPS